MNWARLTRKTNLRDVVNIHVGAIEECAKEAVSKMARLMLTSDLTTIGLATGQSVQSFHSCLLEANRHGDIKLSSCNFIMLDEYLGLDNHDPRSFRHQLELNLLSQIPDKSGVFVYPDTSISDLNLVAHQFDVQARSFSINLQILGIGRNGHLGFNEPGSLLDSRTRIVQLSETTIADLNPHDWPAHTAPQHAVTRGLADIMSSETIFLFAFGRAKAIALRDALVGPVSTDCPASILQSHGNVHVFADDAAVSLIA